MSQFRVFAGVLRGGRVGGCQWLRACGAGPARGAVGRRSCSSGTVTGPSALTSNPSYVEEMYFSWLEDHESVHKVIRDVSTLFNHNLEIQFEGTLCGKCWLIILMQVKVMNCHAAQPSCPLSNHSRDTLYPC